jgi:hypothetical protein
MTRKEALEELIAKVEAGNDAGFRRTNRAVFSTPCQDMALQLREEHARHAYKGSLDAAKALHDAVLPGWWYVIDHRTCSVSDMDDGPFFNASTNDNPARAWLLAILRALHAQEATE